MRRSADFESAVRRGVRSGRSLVVVHVTDAEREADDSTVVGFIVSKQVGSAVTRNKVKRRLRAVMASVVETIPDGIGVVVRALPASAAAPFDDLRRDTLSGLRRGLERTAARGTGARRSAQR